MSNDNQTSTPKVPDDVLRDRARIISAVVEIPRWKTMGDAFIDIIRIINDDKESRHE